MVFILFPESEFVPAPHGGAVLAQCLSFKYTAVHFSVSRQGGYSQERLQTSNPHGSSVFYPDIGLTGQGLH